MSCGEHDAEYLHLKSLDELHYFPINSLNQKEWLGKLSLKKPGRQGTFCW